MPHKPKIKVHENEVGSEGIKRFSSELLVEDEKEVHSNMSGFIDGYVEKGIEQGEEKLSKLILLLQKDGRIEDITKALSDKDARKELYKEFGIVKK